MYSFFVEYVLIQGVIMQFSPSRSFSYILIYYIFIYIFIQPGFKIPVQTGRWPQEVRSGPRWSCHYSGRWPQHVRAGPQWSCHDPPVKNLHETSQIISYRQMRTTIRHSSTRSETWCYQQLMYVLSICFQNQKNS